MNILSTLFLLLISISFAHAEEGIIPKLLEYDVEVIIFEDSNARYINSEVWTQDTVLDTALSDANDTAKNLVKPGSKKIEATSFKNIKPEILNTEYKRINYSKEYNVLFYGSWRQTGLSKNKAFDINIEELKNTHKTKSKNTLTGKFKLVLARYLHIYGDMEYQRKLADTSTQQTTSSNELTETAIEVKEPGNKTYPMNIHRRMRSKVLHYIDHPLVGILIQINPVKASAEETAEKSAAL